MNRLFLCALLSSMASAELMAIPDVPTLLSPANGATNVGTNAVLKVVVSNPSGGNLSVTFYGRPTPVPPGNDFTIVALPDTQYYVAHVSGGGNGEFGGLPAMFNSQTTWIKSNQVVSNIAYVSQLGDCVENGDSYISEWTLATNALYALESAPAIPYGVAVGNHDESPIGDAGGTTTRYNQFFGTSHFAEKSFYGGHYGSDNDNHFDLFSASGLNFIVVYIGYDTNATPAVLNWANGLLQTYSNRRAIVVSHYIGEPTTPSTFGYQGAAIYNALKTNANLFLMLGGHMDGEGSRQDTFNGHTIYSLISNYQFRTNGGSAWMRLMQFSPSNNIIRVSTYTPYYNQYETDFDSQLSLSYAMQTNYPFAPLGTNMGIPSGSSASFIWPGCQPNTSYDWYALISDGSNSRIGSIWQFTTGQSNSPPVVTNLSFSVAGDASTNLALQGSDPNSDPITFQISSSPSHGLLLNLDSVAGGVTYVPAHAFSGPDSFSYLANDGMTNSLPATVTLNVVKPADTNSDGLPDAWELALGVTDPHADPDGDGQSNLQEYLANTNPTDKSSFLHIIGASLNASGQPVISWASVGGTRYRVQFSNGNPSTAFDGIFVDIPQSAASEIDPSRVGTPSVRNFTDDFTLTGGRPPSGARYYRIKVVR